MLEVYFTAITHSQRSTKVVEGRGSELTSRPGRVNLEFAVVFVTAEEICVFVDNGGDALWELGGDLVAETRAANEHGFGVAVIV